MESVAEIVILAVVMNLLFGGPTRIYAMLGLTKLAAKPAQGLRHLQKQLDREHRSDNDREMRGTLLVLFLLVTSVVLGMMVHALKSPAINVIILASLIPVRQSFVRVLRLYRALKRGDVIAARQSMQDTALLHHGLLDEQSLSRAGLEYLGVQFSQRILGDIFWFVLTGLPGLFFSRLLTIMIEACPRQSRALFGKTAITLHGWMHFVPVRFSALLWLVASAFLPVASARPSIRKLLSKWFAMSSQFPNAHAVSLYAVAEALGVSLGGMASAYFPDGWLGSGPAQFSVSYLRSGLFLYALLHLMLFIMLGLFF